MKHLISKGYWLTYMGMKETIDILYIDNYLSLYKNIKPYNTSWMDYKWLIRNEEAGLLYHEKNS